MPGFTEGMLALSNNDTMVKVAEALSVQNFMGGKTFTDVVNKVFEGSPVGPMLAKAMSSAGVAKAGNGSEKQPRT
jgi:hypothetical protein